jgi:beta-lactamase class A
MQRKRGAIRAAATASVLCGALLTGWAVVEHRRADAAALAQPAATPTPTGTATPTATENAAASDAPSPASTVDIATATPATATPDPAATAAPDPGATVLAVLTAALAGQGAHVGIEVLDRVTGAAVGYQASLGFHTASVVKVDILATLLWQGQQSGQRLSGDEEDLAEAMITESDNDAADALWDTIGGARGLTTANRVFGLTQTTPGEAGYWGSTTTTPADQVRLLAMLTDESGPLSADSRAYELGLLGDVESDQRWGVPAAAGSTTTAVYVKDGWLSSPSDDGLWIVNSIGRLVEPGHDWLVAVLSNHHADEDPGIALIQQAAVLAVNGLR